ncbi:MAG: hypothetical protein ABF445_10610, partial [Leuconostoc mesenteroides]
GEPAYTGAQVQILYSPYYTNLTYATTVRNADIKAFLFFYLRCLTLIYEKVARRRHAEQEKENYIIFIL